LTCFGCLQNRRARVECRSSRIEICVKLDREGEKPSIRILNMVCGVAVLILTLHFLHLLHHFLDHTTDPSARTPAFWAGFSAAIVLGVFSFLGGCLLLRRARG
jgi:hypothetical protein